MGFAFLRPPLAMAGKLSAQATGYCGRRGDHRYRIATLLQRETQPPWLPLQVAQLMHHKRLMIADGERKAPSEPYAPLQS
jgi:hypothetical protein